MELKYTIPLAPISKKNSARLVYAKGRIIPIPSKAYKDYEAAALYYLKPAPDSPITDPVNIRCVYYMPTHRRVDKTNLESAIMDILVKAEIISDDNRDIAAMTDGSMVLYDKQNPRTEITITDLGFDYEQWGKGTASV